MAKQVCVIGLGQFGTHLSRALVKLGCEVLVIDRNERRVDAVRDDVHRALIGDARDQQMLESAVTEAVDEAFICLGDTSLEPSILCALNLRRIGVKSIRSTAANDDHAQILRAVGATQIIHPERDAADRAARNVATPDIKDMFPLSENHRVMEMEAPAGTHGKSLAELGLRGRFDVLVLAIRPSENVNYQFLPNADRVIRAGEFLLVFGRELDLAQLANLG
jgi:trk system potassium uptake protein TrkA